MCSVHVRSLKAACAVAYLPTTCTSDDTQAITLTLGRRRRGMAKTHRRIPQSAP